MYFKLCPLNANSLILGALILLALQQVSLSDPITKKPSASELEDLYYSQTFIQETPLTNDSTEPDFDRDAILSCPTAEPIDELGDDCMILKFFNRTQLESMDDENASELVENCACQLARMDHIWREDFDDAQGYQYDLYMMVRGALYKYQRKLADQMRMGKENQLEVEHPKYLWSDIEITAYGVSIYTSTNDFFHRRIKDPSVRLSKDLKAKLKNTEYGKIEDVCGRIAADGHKLYRYLENLIRANRFTFFMLIRTSDIIENVYQASKSCKLLLLLHMDKYKLRPDNMAFVPVDDIRKLPMSQSIAILEYSNKNNIKTSSDDESENTKDEQNTIQQEQSNADIDHMFKYASALLLNCSHWQGTRSTIKELEHDCPMMMMSDEKVPKEWIIRHPSSASRTKVSIRCGCQLLLHNSTWNEMMLDSNIKIMSQAITNYMVQNRIPNFMDTPVWTIYAWFEDIMAKFSNNKKLAIKEIIKTRRGDVDPEVVLNKSTHDQVDALELLRRGCNYIMLNYNKGSNAASEIKLINYLDNLQLISQDRMFVFHLSLQDPNLFKIHALSKMCYPIVYG